MKLSGSKKLPFDYRIIFLIVLNLLLTLQLFGINIFGSLFSGESYTNKANKIDVSSLDSKNFPELKELKNNTGSFNSLSDFFENMAEEKGGEYAFNALRIAEIPAGTDLHLLAHVVGDVLYKQKGILGMYSCTQDFRNACSHTIVVGLFYDKGEKALAEIAGACRKAPGGSGAYTMCFHGLGHGVLAYTGYDLEKTAELCKKTGTAEYNNREISECIGGSIMEIIGGVHDKEAWERQHKKYFKDEDPLYPCTAEFIPKDSKSMCYTYLTPHLFTSAGGDLGNPYSSFKKAFTYCDAIPKDNSHTGERNNCYGGFGKEFIVLARERDVRDIESSTIRELEKVYTWCKLSTNKEGVTSCLLSAASSLYWGGENHYKAALGLCDVIHENDYKRACFESTIGSIFYYRGKKSEEQYLKDFCSSLPEEYKATCNQRLNNI